MPDRRKHRGPHPHDRRLFDPARLPAMRTAVNELAYLLTRGYAEKSALKIVGDRHALTARQRMAVMRATCNDHALADRRRREIPWDRISASDTIAIDGYNLLITIEAALSGGPIFIGRDRCCRDLAGVHGTYRRIEETGPALSLIIDALADHDPRVCWFFDRPVSNSGRLKTLLEQILRERDHAWPVTLTDNPDRALAEGDAIVASSDAWVLDHCHRWINLAAILIRRHIHNAWLIDLSNPAPPPSSPTPPP